MGRAQPPGVAGPAGATTDSLARRTGEGQRRRCGRVPSRAAIGGEGGGELQEQTRRAATEGNGWRQKEDDSASEVQGSPNFNHTHKNMHEN